MLAYQMLISLIIQFFAQFLYQVGRFFLSNNIMLLFYFFYGISISFFLLASFFFFFIGFESFFCLILPHYIYITLLDNYLFISIYL